MRQDYLEYDENKNRLKRFISTIALFILGGVLVYFTDIILVEENQTGVVYETRNPQNPQLLDEGIYFNFADYMIYHVYDKEVQNRSIKIPVRFQDAVKGKITFDVTVDLSKIDMTSTSRMDLYTVVEILENTYLSSEVYSIAMSISGRNDAVDVIENTYPFKCKLDSALKKENNPILSRKDYISYSVSSEPIEFEKQFLRIINEKKQVQMEINQLNRLIQQAEKIK